MVPILLLFVGLSLFEMTNSEANQCECENDYEPLFCDGIKNKDTECYIGDKKQKLSPKGVHCAKSCETCCKLPRFQCKDRGVRLDCDKIRRSGLCKTSHTLILSLISAECPWTCGLCGQECVDSNAAICAILKQSCENEESKRLCPMTCNVCRPINICFDTTAHCSLLKDSCDDPKMKPLMQSSCNETCGFCNSESSTIKPDLLCVDKDSRCAMWAANGFCTNPFYKSAVRQCSKTCRLC